MSNVELDLTKLKDLNYTDAIYIPYCKRSTEPKELTPTKLDKIKKFLHLKVNPRYVYPLEFHKKILREQELFSIETLQAMEDGDTFTWGEEGNEKEYIILNSQKLPFKPEMFTNDDGELTCDGITLKQWSITPMMFYQVGENDEMR